MLLASSSRLAVPSRVPSGGFVFVILMRQELSHLGASIFRVAADFLSSLRPLCVQLFTIVNHVMPELGPGVLYRAFAFSWPIKFF